MPSSHLTYLELGLVTQASDPVSPLLASDPLSLLLPISHQALLPMFPFLALMLHIRLLATHASNPLSPFARQVVLKCKVLPISSQCCSQIFSGSPLPTESGHTKDLKWHFQLAFLCTTTFILSHLLSAMSFKFHFRYHTLQRTHCFSCMYLLSQPLYHVIPCLVGYILSWMLLSPKKIFHSPRKDFINNSFHSCICPS